MNKNVLSDKARKSSFLGGVFVLTASTLIVKVIGLLYKIPMLSYLGAEGMGYFNSAYEIYALLCVISTTGLPTALSILVASHRGSGTLEGIYPLYKTAMRVFVVIGTVGSGVMLIFARQISMLIENENAYYCILAISPALLFVCVSSAIRGYFQGLGSMTPTAVSQLIEALGKLVLGIMFAIFAMKKGYSVCVSAAFAVLGLSLGTLLSALYLLIKRGKARHLDMVHGDVKKERGIAKALLRIALPITLSSAVISTTRIIDMAMIMRRLQDIGYTSAVANEVYGAYTTMAVPIFGLIPSLLSPVSLALVPELSAAIERKAEHKQSGIVDTSIRLTVFFALPSTLALVLYARPVVSVLFSRSGELVEYIAPVLSVLSISVLFSCMITTTNAILQSYRQTSKPIISMAIGAVLKVVTAYILIGMPSINIYGAPISTFICDASITVINLIFIYKKAPLGSGIISTYIKPLIASVAAIAMSFAVYIPMCNAVSHQELAFLVAALFAVVTYVVISIIIKAITPEDISMLPGGEKINGILNKISPIKKFISKKEKENE